MRFFFGGLLRLGYQYLFPVYNNICDKQYNQKSLAHALTCTPVSVPPIRSRGQDKQAWGRIKIESNSEEEKLDKIIQLIGTLKK